ncbi:unnamed protein product [Anisakis simplex]|uniref:Uncharacterized protein n=1 Tax=Anisakis simplex TaxID=6269 RepID=A0A0M3K998_ANISI|nr:unnamed protein product [Anisakis simplex]
MSSTRALVVALVLLQLLNVFFMTTNAYLSDGQLDRFKRQYGYGGGYSNYGGGVDNNYGGTDIGSINTDNTDITVY